MKILTLKEYKQKVARSGGKAVLKKYGKDHFKKLQAKGVAKRMANKKASLAQEKLSTDGLTA